jgi:rubrerythrin
MEAEALYVRLAGRESDPKKAAILLQIAEAEVKHRIQIEKRLRALGAVPPNPAEFWLSPWLQIKARLAPRDGFLARMQTTEQEEISNLYDQTTGDAETDRLFQSIKQEEQDHSAQLQGLRAGTELSKAP